MGLLDKLMFWKKDTVELDYEVSGCFTLPTDQTDQNNLTDQNDLTEQADQTEQTGLADHTDLTAQAADPGAKPVIATQPLPEQSQG